MLKTANELQKDNWDAFVLKHGPRSGRFLQSWSWGEFQKSVGEKVDRVAWMSDVNEVDAIAQVIRKNIPHFGSYTYIPRGPIVSSKALPAKEELGEVSIGDIANGEMFVRVEFPNAGQAQDLPLQTIKTNSIQPANTLMTYLSISTDELLANMHEKTRYNIRLAEKKGVKIKIGTISIDEVWPVFEATASRDAFRLHGKEYYRKMIESGVAFLAIAKHENDILAADIMIDFGDTRTYLHGASSNMKRNLMAPYLLHWELMQDAKSAGITVYDWWGVAPVDAAANHPWAGISRFKRGFGGEEVLYPDAVDVVLKPWRYAMYKILRKLRRGLR